MPTPAKTSRPSALQIAGELVLTLGVVLGLFVVWQLWWTNLEATATQKTTVAHMARDFDSSPQPANARETGHGNPAVSTAPSYGQGLGIMYIPRFGADYARPIIEGTGAQVLDTLGLGHYQGTAMPGDLGNFAVAGHRQTNGKALDLIHTLTPGDLIHVRTATGYYTYTVTTSEVVAPTTTRVIAPNPAEPTAEPTRRLLTLTSCHPRYGDTERYIVHAQLESWRPQHAAPPGEIATTATTPAERN